MTNGSQPPAEQGITAITVRGFKSLYDESRIEIRPLTLLAGANSSGKSSIMQPLLLLKQTLEASYDPGPLLLDGPIVKFTSVDQMLSRATGELSASIFSVGVELEGLRYIACSFRKQPRKSLELVETISRHSEAEFRLRPQMTKEEVDAEIINMMRTSSFNSIGPFISGSGWHWQVIRERCFLTFRLIHAPEDSDLFKVSIAPITWDQFPPFGSILEHLPGNLFESDIRGLIHVAGLRGSPARTYPKAAPGPDFPGTFDPYIASVIDHWQLNKDARLQTLGQNLTLLGLARRVLTQPIADTQIELLISRLPPNGRNSTRDMVSIADVGFGVSQILPVLVALLAAKSGQLVYLEQPEIHLHPRAQTALAGVLADAAKRGVRVVVETHSSLLLLGIQTLVAEGTLDPALVKLHWFERDPQTGSSKINSADLDESGAFGDWPEDFAIVDLDAQGRYLDAAESRLVAH